MRGDSAPPAKGQSTKDLARICHAWLGQGRTGVDGEVLCYSWMPCVSPWLWVYPKAGCLAILAQPKGVWAKTSLAGSAPRSSTHWCSCEPSEAGVN